MTDWSSEELLSLINQARADMGITDRGGVSWHEAPLPPWLHRCKPWTTSPTVSRCACGATRLAGYPGWMERNSRRKQARRRRPARSARWMIWSKR